MVDCICILSALLFFASNLMEIISDILTGRDGEINYQYLKELEPDYLMNRWLGQDQTTARLALAAGIIKTLAWFTFMVPILQVAWILSRGGKRKLSCHVLISTLAIGGTLGEVISRLMLLGSYQASNWVAKDFNLYNWTDRVNDDNIGWRVLQISYIIVEGAIIWVDAFEWLALFGIFAGLYYSIVTLPHDGHSLGIWLARLGLLIGLLCLFDFVSDLLRVENWSAFSKFAVLISIVNMLVLLPCWLILLSIQLPSAQPKYDFNSAEEEAFVTDGESDLRMSVS
jgi:hypothetical protein